MSRRGKPIQAAGNGSSTMRAWCLLCAIFAGTCAGLYFIFLTGASQSLSPRLRASEAPLARPLQEQPQPPPPPPSVVRDRPERNNNNITTLLIVLGNMPLDDSTPTVDMMERVRTAVRAFKTNPLSTMLVFSGGPTAGKMSEARTGFNFAASLGVEEKAMLLEEKARTTEENAILTAKLLMEKNIRPAEIFIVSKQDHLDWAMGIFKSNRVPDHFFANARPMGCTVDRKDSIAQMVKYLETHPDNKMVRHRLRDLRNGVQGID